MSKEAKINGNGTFKKVSLVIALITFAVSIAVAWGSWRTTVQKLDAQVVRLDEQKVDQAVFDECVEGIRRDIGEIKAGQIRTDTKLDKILEKL